MKHFLIALTIAGVVCIPLFTFSYRPSNLPHKPTLQTYAVVYEMATTNGMETGARFFSTTRLTDKIFSGMQTFINSNAPQSVVILNIIKLDDE